MVAREGMLPLTVVLAAGAVTAYYVGLVWSLPLWVLGAFLFYLFREADPAVPNLPLAVLSPGDGTVQNVSSQPDPWVDRVAHRVRIRLGRLGTGVLRSPVEGKVLDYRTSDQPFNKPGVLDETGTSPNCYSVHVGTDEGDDLVFVVSSLRPISRFKLYASPGERIGIGHRIGFLYFGDILDVFIPVSADTKVGTGAPVVAGSTVLAHLQTTAAREAAGTG